MKKTDPTIAVMPPSVSLPVVLFSAPRKLCATKPTSDGGGYTKLTAGKTEILQSHEGGFFVKHFSKLLDNLIDEDEIEYELFSEKAGHTRRRLVSAYARFGRSSLTTRGLRGPSSSW